MCTNWRLVLKVFELIFVTTQSAIALRAGRDEDSRKYYALYEETLEQMYNEADGLSTFYLFDFLN